MKLNTRTTKKEMVERLGNMNLSNVREEIKLEVASLKERLLKNPTKVTRDELFNFFKKYDAMEAEQLLESAGKEVAKKKLKKVAKEEATKESEKAVDTEKSAKEEEQTEEQGNELINGMFPKTLENGAYKVNNDIKTFRQLTNEYNTGKTILVAFYWNKQLLKQYGYGGLNLQNQPTEFENDLDICQLIHVGENNPIAYALSLATDGIYNLVPEDIEMDKKTGIHYCRGCEYVIYTQA